MPPLNDNVLEYSQPSRWNSQNHGDELYSPTSSFARRTVPRDRFSDAHKPTGSTRQRQGGTQVRFNEEVNVHFVINLQEITPEEIQQCWYNPNEYNEFKSDVAVTVYLIQNNPGKVDDIKYTRRGAEIRIDSILEQRHNWKREARSEVLSEQYAQNMMGFLFKDEEKIASLYKVASQPAILEAIELAKLDRNDAESYYSYIHQAKDGCLEAEQSCFSQKRRHRKKLSDFNDSWITSISSEEEEGPFLSNNYQHSSPAVASNEHPFFLDDSGFDDSWLREVSVQCR